MYEIESIFFNHAVLYKQRDYVDGNRKSDRSPQARSLLLLSKLAQNSQSITNKDYRTNSIHLLCECKALASLRHVYLGSFCLEPEDIKSIILGAIWNFSKATGLP
jgi:hypothetical protein